MSSYTTVAGLAKRAGGYLPLAQLASDGAAVYNEADAETLVATTDPAATLAQAIEDASQIIDETVQAQIDLTGSAAAKMEQYATWIALHLLYMRRNNVSEEQSSYYSMFKWSMKRLEAIAARKLVVTTPPDSPASMFVSTTAGQTPKFRDRTADTEPLENF